jgi:transglutaminase-like putative cysteine protease
VIESLKEESSFILRMQSIKLIVGLVLMTTGVILIFGAVVIQFQTTRDVWAETRSNDVYTEYVERREYTYFLEQSFLLTNPSNNTVTDLVYMLLPVNASNQFVKLIETNPAPLYRKSGEDGVEMLIYNVTLPGSGEIWINATLQLTVERYRLLMENIPWPNYLEVEENTGGKRYWAVENETYVRIAKEICLDARDPVSASKRIGEWIRSHLRYQLVSRKGAEHALVIEDNDLILVGDCEEVADVFVTLARILGIRARVAHGIYLLEDKDVVTMWILITDNEFKKSDNWGGHAWPQVFISGVGWVDIELLEEFDGEDFVKIGDFSQYHIKYGFEEKSFFGSTISYCQAMYFKTVAFYFTFRRS